MMRAIGLFKRIKLEMQVFVLWCETLRLLTCELALPSGP